MNASDLEPRGSSSYILEIHARNVLIGITHFHCSMLHSPHLYGEPGADVLGRS